MLKTHFITIRAKCVLVFWILLKKCSSNLPLSCRDVPLRYFTKEPSIFSRQEPVSFFLRKRLSTLDTHLYIFYVLPKVTPFNRVSRLILQ